MDARQLRESDDITAALVQPTIVAVLLEHFDDAYSGRPRMSEFEAVAIAVEVERRLYSRGDAGSQGI